MKLNELRIAIDGGAATGKSSISKELANKLGINYLNTGDLYRIIAYFAIKNNILSEKELLKNLSKIKIYFDKEKSKISSNIDFTYENLHSNIVSEKASFFAQFSSVRNFLLDIQKEIAKEKGILLEGRDIGTKIMPNADIKFFLTVSNKEAAKRRFEELKIKNSSLTLKEVEEDIKLRNNNDTNRLDSPLVKAYDAIEIDTSNFSKNEIIEKIYLLILERFENE